MPEMKQHSEYWYCNLCEQIASVPFLIGEPPELVVKRIAIAHRKIRGGCVGDLHIVEEDRYTSWFDILMDDAVPSWAVTRIAQVLGYGDQVPK